MNPTTTTIPPLRLISIEETGRRINKRKSWLYAAIRGGNFPAPVRVGGSTNFVESEIDAWIRSQIEARDAETPPARRAKRGHAAAPAASV
jgi:predicted DNA-binding transcriptional regulator AlpA